MVTHPNTRLAIDHGFCTGRRLAPYTLALKDNQAIADVGSVKNCVF